MCNSSDEPQTYAVGAPKTVKKAPCKTMKTTNFGPQLTTGSRLWRTSGRSNPPPNVPPHIWSFEEETPLSSSVHLFSCILFSFHLLLRRFSKVAVRGALLGEVLQPEFNKSLIIIDPCCVTRPIVVSTSDCFVTYR